MPSVLMIWPDNPGLSLALWLILLILVMFGARTPAHRAIQGIAKAITQGCNLAADAITALRERVSERNREVLLASGLEEAEQQMSREFERISTTVTRDLGAYPELHRSLAEQVKRIDEDYRRSVEGPPESEAWASTVSAVGELVERTGAQGPVLNAVDALREGLVDAHDEAMEHYRAASRERHRLLARMRPTWRSMSATLTRVEQSVSSLFERARHIDDMMDRYNEISSRSDRAERALQSSAMTQFLTASLVLVVASLGGFINFQLIALPMSEMVGATSRLGTMQTSDVAALVIILIEITMGLFLMESLRITRLFPVIGRLDERMRKRMAIATFSLLFILASIEASLAYMRDLLAADRAALTQALAGGAIERPEFMWIPAVGQMVMGFILPFALTFVAIPLESFIQSSRAVGGQVVVGLLRLLAFTVQLFGFAADHAGKGLKNIYDIVIFLPLKIEEMVLSGRSARSVKSRKAEGSASTA